MAILTCKIVVACTCIYSIHFCLQISDFGMTKYLQPTSELGTPVSVYYA